MIRETVVKQKTVIALKYISIVLIITIAILLLCTYFYQPFFLVKLVQKTFHRILFYVETDQKNYALTFDDGPNPQYTDTVLEILDKHEAKATFFLIGSRVELYPEYVRKIKEKGHQIGNHTYYDEPSIFLTKETLIQSIQKTENLIRQEYSPKLFRPGSGWISKNLLDAVEDAGYKTVLGSAYVSDSFHPPRWYMKAALDFMLRPGIIVILHDGIKNPQKTIDVLPSLLEAANRKGLNPVILSTLLRNRNN